MKTHLLFGAAIGALVTASILPASAQNLVRETAGVPGAVVGTAVTVPGAVIQGVAGPLVGEGTGSLREFRAEALRAMPTRSSRAAWRSSDRAIPGSGRMPAP